MTWVAQSRRTISNLSKQSLLVILMISMWLRRWHCDVVQTALEFVFCVWIVVGNERVFLRDNDDRWRMPHKRQRPRHQRFSVEKTSAQKLNRFIFGVCGCRALCRCCFCILLLLLLLSLNHPLFFRNRNM